MYWVKAYMAYFSLFLLTFKLQESFVLSMAMSIKGEL